jgi:hypothetical protein
MTKKKKSREPNQQFPDVETMTPAEIRAELLSLVNQITAGSEEQTEDEHSELVGRWNEICPHPGGSDILFWPNELGLCTGENISTFTMTNEEMVDFAINWQPRVVAMKVTQRDGSERTGYYWYHLEAPETPKTRVATPLSVVYQKGDVVAVALRGVRLMDGTRIKTEFSLKVFSCGRILGPTAEVCGTRIVGHPGVID